MIYFIVLFSQDLRIKLKLGTSLSKQADNGLYSDINTSHLQFFFENNWASSFYIIETDFLAVVFDEFVGPCVVNFSDMVYDVCIVCMMILTRSLAFKSKAVRLY